jgi:hypothetical protein
MQKRLKELASKDATTTINLPNPSDRFIVFPDIKFVLIQRLINTKVKAQSFGLTDPDTLEQWQDFAQIIKDCQANTTPIIYALSQVIKGQKHYTLDTLTIDIQKRKNEETASKKANGPS